MRILFFTIALLISGSGLNAQIVFPDRTPLSVQQPLSPIEDAGFQRNWKFEGFAALNTGIMSWKGGAASISSVAVGLQVYRPLANNFFAFGSVSVAPTYVHFNHAFANPGVKSNLRNLYSVHGNPGLSSRSSLGLMYINEEKTFSVSGSINVERSNSPVYLSPVYQNSSPLINRW